MSPKQTKGTKQWERDPIRNLAFFVVRIINQCRHLFCEQRPAAQQCGLEWSNYEFFLELTKSFIQQRASGHAKSIAWKTTPSNQLRYFTSAKTVMMTISQDGTLTTYSEAAVIQPSKEALDAHEKAQSEWHYIPKGIAEQWKLVTQNKPTFFEQELFQRGRSMSAHIFIAARLILARWITKSRETGVHETITASDIGEILRYNLTESVQFSYLFEKKENAADCVKKTEEKLYLQAVVKAGGFADVTSVRQVGKWAKNIAALYVRNERKGKSPRNATPSQCGELWSALLRAYNFAHWKQFMADPSCDKLPADAIIGNTLYEAKKLLVTAAMEVTSDRRRQQCITLLKENIPISTTYFRRLVQLRANYFIGTITRIEGDNKVKEVKDQLLKLHQKVLEDHSP